MNNNQYLIIGGTFNNSEGKPSSIVTTMSNKLGFKSINGGNLNILQNLNLLDTEILIWMPNIDNLEDKILPGIKKKYPKLLLISSKRVIEKNYNDFDIITRLLSTHSNLGIKITKTNNNQYSFKLLDPLGNMYSDTNNLDTFCIDLKNRLSKLLSGKRIKSNQLILSQEDQDVPKNVVELIENRFIDIVKSYGKEFTHYVNAVNSSRLLGNASTRCSKGFPALKLNNTMYLISKRNVDKETLSKNDFVLTMTNENPIQYFGDIKPSVDAPIQIRLFNYYLSVKYIIHGHVYIKNAPFTEHKNPCGYIEEFDDIIKLIPNHKQENFCINLLGHGCLILANDLDYLESQISNLYSRPFPES